MGSITCFYSDFESTKFYYIDFSNSIFDHSNFNKSYFKQLNIIKSSLKDVNLSNSILDILYHDNNIDFINSNLTNAILNIDSEINETQINSFSQAIIAQAIFNDPIIGRKVRDQQYINKLKEQIFNYDLSKYKGIKKCFEWANNRFYRILFYLWKITSDYGRNLFLWLLISIVTAFIFALLYSFCMTHNNQMVINDYVITISTNQTICNNENTLITNYICITNIKETNILLTQLELPEKFTTAMYYSIITFTTLGFGDIIPLKSSFWAQLFVVIEVIIGYLMLGGLLSILGNKFARRHD